MGLKKFAWKKFYKDILEKGDSLDKVIDFIQSQIDSLSDPKEIHTLDQYSFEGEPQITGFEINHHFLDCLKVHYHKLETDNLDEKNRYFWNLANNLLRGLKKYKGDEAFYLLPQEDQKLTLDFITRLERPPVRYYSRNYFY